MSYITSSFIVDKTTEPSTKKKGIQNGERMIVEYVSHAQLSNFIITLSKKTESKAQIT
jgi:hypothetical protein